jgi:hypothetical protein
MSDQMSAPLTKTNTSALISLLAGIAGLTFLPFVGSIVAVLLGQTARKEIDLSGGAQTGDGLARAGVILGWIGIGLAVIGVCFACVVILVSVGIPIWLAGSETSMLGLVHLI